MLHKVELAHKNLGAKMDTDIISYETLLATQYSADWVKYGAIASWLAAVGAILTLICAGSALNTWKKQEKTKIRSEFKRSLLALDFAIHMMPDEWNASMARAVLIKSRLHIVSEGSVAEVSFNELKKCWHDALSAWVMCEGLLMKSDLPNLWSELSAIYVKYTQGFVSKKTILEKLAEMHSLEFIFD